MRRLRESWSEVVIVGLAEAAIGLIATKIYGDAASNEYLHDIGLIIIWLAVLVLAFLFLTRDIWRTMIGEAVTPSVPNGSAVASTTSAQKGVEAIEFEPYLHLSSTIFQLDVSGLWGENERHIDVIVYARAIFDNQVTIAGVVGPMRIGDEECSLPPRLVNGPRQLRERGGNYDCIIRQPLMSEMAQALLMNPGKKNLTWEDGRVRVSLAGMKWVGTVHTPNGDKPLPDRIVSDETILVRGPLCKSNTDQRLWRLEPIFLSQEWYYLHDGSLRTPEPVDTSQSTAPPPMSPELVQFVNAWFMPAWDQAIDRLLRIEGALNTRMGGSVELLLQKGIIDPAVASWRAVQERLRGERTERSQRPRGGDVSELRADSPLGPRSSNYGQLAIRQ